ncbi:hypothetical protein COU37_04570 [Candidatus Micrarchaeota archaeon CG10_big_fil_rev_8_21_14_0_10_45_29]|nr:MAG: hypothetical protein COU37_04570 [Candidatus Micrarchaeota archaeon CG10_big_fil_rev_8_21_14_0_10_45_29]
MGARKSRKQKPANAKEAKAPGALARASFILNSKIPFYLTDEANSLKDRGAGHFNIKKGRKIPPKLAKEANAGILQNEKYAKNASVQVVPSLSGDVALKRIISAIRTEERRADILIGERKFHVSQAPGGEMAAIVLELFSREDVPEQISSLFNFPAAAFSRSRENMYEAAHRAYLVSFSAKEEKELSAAGEIRIAVAGNLLYKLARLHGIGMLAGNVSSEDIVLCGIEPKFNSAAHLEAMQKMGECIPEALNLICQLEGAGLILHGEERAFLQQYLKSDANAYLHATYFVEERFGAGEKDVEGKLLEALAQTKKEFY